MDKRIILQAIKEEAERNGGRPPGRDGFSARTGIRESDWCGKHWARWSDAVREAGFLPNEFQTATDRQPKFRQILEITRKLGRFPTVAEMRLEKRSNPAVPDPRNLMRSGGRSGLLNDLREFCKQAEEFRDCIPILDLEPEPGIEPSQNTGTASTEYLRTYIYLIRSGKYYKIGLTSATYRRASQIANGNPHGAELIHSFETDDGRGIETYWHTRFADKRIRGVNIASGEWFQLDAKDVAAFKRRKSFM